MAKRLQTIAMIIALMGIGFVVAGGIAFFQVQNGYNSLHAFSSEQNVMLQYNEDGQLLDRGAPEGAEAILTMLREDWAYPVVESDLDPADPLVNTATEYMYQMAVIGFHVLHGTQTVVLDETVEYDGVTYEAGTYEFAVDGRYWTDFDRQHPLEGPARSQAWSGTAHGLFGELGVGAVTASTLQLGLALAGTLAAIGLTLLIAGSGLWWATRSKETAEAIEVSAPAMPKQRAPIN